MSYLKNLKVVFALLERMTNSSSISQILDIEGALVHCLRLLEEALTSFDNTVAMQACSAIDNIGTYLIEHPEVGTRFPYLNEHLQRVLSLVVQLFISGEFSSVWSLSKVFARSVQSKETISFLCRRR